MSKKDLIEQNITRVQEYVRELIEDAKWNNGVSETLESTSIIVGNSDDIYDFAILFASNTECVYCEFIDSKIEYIDCELDCEICQFVSVCCNTISLDALVDLTVEICDLRASSCT